MLIERHFLAILYGVAKRSQSAKS